MGFDGYTNQISVWGIRPILQFLTQKLKWCDYALLYRCSTTNRSNKLKLSFILQARKAPSVDMSTIESWFIFDHNFPIG
ncbi:hypothetical protein CGZ80_06285 [Rhodopirellula sp. MGV]|nr:hypothetical protein CGZ80_06285 [Rhodopirellula sp. MGV]PNY36270.1 hypothetical protein C2E31_14305 [Rhodopirellula baltica]